jgi:hypothetical protein
LKITKVSPIIGLLISKVNIKFYFYKNRIGLHIGLFYQKRIRSPWQIRLGDQKKLLNPDLDVLGDELGELRRVAGLAAGRQQQLVGQVHRFVVIWSRIYVFISLK